MAEIYRGNAKRKGRKKEETYSMLFWKRIPSPVLSWHLGFVTIPTCFVEYALIAFICQVIIPRLNPSLDVTTPLKSERWTIPVILVPSSLWSWKGDGEELGGVDRTGDRTFYSRYFEFARVKIVKTEL